MARIGVFIDLMNEKIPYPIRKRVSSFIEKIPELAFFVEENDLSSPDAIQRMIKYLEKGEADRVLIIGGNPKIYEKSFNKCGFPIPLNPYLFSVADIIEQALWATLNEEEASEKAIEVIRKSIKTVSLTKPIETQSISLKPEVLVIGGGISGISVSLALAQSGIHVELIEKEKEIGGKALSIRSFYNNPEDAQIWIKERISEVYRNPNINIHTQSEIIYLEGKLGCFKAKIRKFDQTQIELTPSAIVVAIGFEIYRERKGILAHKRVINLSEMERLISESKYPIIQWDGREIELVTFLLDEVNEDIKIDSINAIKQAYILQEKFKCQVSILCKDVKVSADGMERLYRKARGQGVLFFKYEEEPKLSIVNGQIQIDLKETSVIKREDQWSISILSDLLVLGESFIPNRKTEALSQILHINTGSRGFLMEDNPQLMRIRSNRRGIFILGACRFPQEISETLIESRAVAQEVIALLTKGKYTYDLSVAEVDPKKCALCYTCPRLCPHYAITIERYAERNVYINSFGGEKTNCWAARVDPASCFGCGICVGECPAKAITLHHLRDEQIYAQIGLI